MARLVPVCSEQPILISILPALNRPHRHITCVHLANLNTYWIYAHQYRAKLLIDCLLQPKPLRLRYRLGAGWISDILLIGPEEAIRSLAVSDMPNMRNLETFSFKIVSHQTSAALPHILPKLVCVVDACGVAMAAMELRKAGAHPVAARSSVRGPHNCSPIGDVHGGPEFSPYHLRPSESAPSERLFDQHLGC